MEQLGFFVSLGKTNKQLALTLILVQADRMDKRSLLGIGDPESCSIKHFSGKSWLSMEYCERRKIYPYYHIFRYAWMLIIRLSLIVLLTKVCWNVSSSMTMKTMFIYDVSFYITLFVAAMSSRQFFGLTCATG